MPPEAQKEAADFITFLQSEYNLEKNRLRKKKKRPLESEPFVRMWKDRKDMEDSVKWVRALRDIQRKRDK